MSSNGMDRDLKEKWVNALRSGHYKQTVGVLKQRLDDGEYGYCCLGVLCDLIFEHGEGSWVGPQGCAFGTTSDCVSDTELPHPLSRELGFYDPWPAWSEEIRRKYDIDYDDHIETALMKWNDGGHSFEWIADRIEKDL